MFKMFKCLILFSAVSVVFAITSVRDDANWFKNRNKLKNRWAVNGIHDRSCEENTPTGKIPGECLSRVECTKKGGKPGGHCSLLGVCCIIEKSCSGTTSSKLSYFVPSTPLTPQCSLTVNIYSRDVCQIRLDFEDFDIAGPTSTPINANGVVMGFTAFQCNTDTFKVEEVGKNLGFSSLCGKNKGQHIYVPVAENQSKIVLRFDLKSIEANQNQAARWRIKIRQLECQKGNYEPLNAQTKLMSMFNSLKDKKERKHSKSDYELIAPPNCLQYHSEKTGKFESFNYDNGNGMYIGPMNYAICFRKTPDTCGVQFKYETLFQMNYNPFRPNEPFENKCHPRLAASTAVSQDYVRIPGGVNLVREFNDYYCNTDFDQLNNQITAKSLEPLYIGVHTDEFRPFSGDPDHAEVGFRLAYETQNCDNPM